MQLIQQFLQRVNEESGKTENKFGLEMLEKKLTFNKKHMHTQDIVSVGYSKQLGEDTHGKWNRTI